MRRHLCSINPLAPSVIAWLYVNDIQAPRSPPHAPEATPTPSLRSRKIKHPHLFTLPNSKHRECCPKFKVSCLTIVSYLSSSIAYTISTRLIFFNHKNSGSPMFSPSISCANGGWWFIRAFYAEKVQSSVKGDGEVVVHG